MSGLIELSWQTTSELTIKSESDLVNIDVMQVWMNVLVYTIIVGGIEC